MTAPIRKLVSRNTERKSVLNVGVSSLDDLSRPNQLEAADQCLSLSRLAESVGTSTDATGMLHPCLLSTHRGINLNPGGPRGLSTEASRAIKSGVRRHMHPGVTRVVTRICLFLSPVQSLLDVSGMARGAALKAASFLIHANHLACVSTISILCRPPRAEGRVALPPTPAPPSLCRDRPGNALPAD